MLGSFNIGFVSIKIALNIYGQFFYNTSKNTNLFQFIEYKALLEKG